MKLFNRIVCLLLIALMCVPTFAACGKKTDGGTESQSVDQTQTQAPTPVGDEDTLPEYDFGDEEINVLYRESRKYEWSPNEKDNASVVNTALYQRDGAVSSRFNVNVNYESTPGDWSNREELLHRISSITDTGDYSAYDMVAGIMSVVPNLSIHGLTLNLFDLPNVDLSKKWWSEDYVEGATVNGKIYMALGDIAHGIYEGMEVIFVNETLAYSYLNGVDLYQLVEEGEWTFEKLKEFTETVQYNENDGRYGLLLNAHAVRNFNASFEVEMAVQDDLTNKYSFPLQPTERTGNIFETLRDFCNSNTSVYYKEKTQDDIKASNALFAESKALFYAQRLKAAESLINSDISYGILPFPKWDDGQLEYHTSLKDDVTAFCVPLTIKDREMVGTVLEALCMYGYQKVRPAYYEQVLSYRLLGNPELANMLDSIRDSLTVSFEMAYNWALSYPYSYGSGLLKDSPIVSSWESQATVWNGGIAELYEAIR